MKHIIWRPFWNFEKEEKWLNTMSGRGQALKNVWWIRYVFEDTPPGEYTYRIELLEKSHQHPKSRAYMNFLQDTGVEYVSGYMRWVYLRKKTADGPFELYTDLDSRIRHYKTVRSFWAGISFLGLYAGLFNLYFAITDMLENEMQLLLIEGSLAALSLMIGLSCLLFLCRPLDRKIKTLRQEREIHE
jgi:hypothetical protein